MHRYPKSSLRFGVINVGVESFTKSFTKNQKYEDTKKLFRRLTDYGVGVLASYIVGFDHQNHENVWEGIRKLIDLDAMNYLILNLKSNLKI